MQYVRWRMKSVSSIDPNASRIRRMHERIERGYEGYEGWVFNCSVCYWLGIKPRRILTLDIEMCAGRVLVIVALMHIRNALMLLLTQLMAVTMVVVVVVVLTMTFCP